MSTDPRDLEKITAMAADSDLRALSRKLFLKSCEYRYSYNFTWLGRPIIQYPQDIVATQEIIWRTRPDLIIETGVAHGGSLMLTASILELLGGGGRVIGVDIEIRPHNRAAIEAHPLSRCIDLIEGSSIDPQVFDKVRKLALGCGRVMVILDSNHTHEHVLRELELYSPLVTRGCYLIVFDTVIEEMPEDAFPERPWSRGNNPMTAVREFLSLDDRFEVDGEVESKLLITVAPGGYLRRVRD